MTTTVPAASADPTPRVAAADPVLPDPPRRRRRGLADVAYPVMSALLFLIMWELVSRRVSADVLPGPVASVAAIGDAWTDGYLWSDMVTTARRIGGAFGLAFAAAVTAGITFGIWPPAARLFGPWVTIFASIPSLLLIVVAYLWVGLNDRAAVLGGAVIVWPSITFNVWQGMRSLDPQLAAMAAAFAVPRHVVVRRVLFPQTVPFLFAAARLGLALTWKIMIFVELLGRSSGVGYRIQYWYQLFNMERVLGSALPFIALMVALEFVVLRPIERHLNRWRPQAVPR